MLQNDPKQQRLLNFLAINWTHSKMVTDTEKKIKKTKSWAIFWPKIFFLLPQFLTEHKIRHMEVMVRDVKICEVALQLCIFLGEG